MKERGRERREGRNGRGEEGKEDVGKAQEEWRGRVNQ